MIYLIDIFECLVYVMEAEDTSIRNLRFRKRSKQIILGQWDNIYGKMIYRKLR